MFLPALISRSESSRPLAVVVCHSDGAVRTPLTLYCPANCQLIAVNNSDTCGRLLRAMLGGKKGNYTQLALRSWNPVVLE